MTKKNLIFTLSFLWILGLCFQGNAQEKFKRVKKVKTENLKDAKIIDSKKLKKLKKSIHKQRQVQQNRKIDYRYTGKLNVNDLKSSPYTMRWYAPRYKRYSPHPGAMKTIKAHIGDYEIKVFMGTWCPDSHREIPRLFKILEQADYDLDQLTMYALNHRMHSKNRYEAGYHIKRVPTIIFYKDGKEVNRFVEHARESLAKDIAQIVSGKPYVDYLKNLNKR